MSAIFTYNLNEYNNSFHSTPSGGAINNYIDIQTIREFCFICQNFQNIITLIQKLSSFSAESQCLADLNQFTPSE